MEKEHVLVIGLVVIGLAAPAVHASMSTGTLEFGPLTYSGAFDGSVALSSVSGTIQPLSGLSAEFGPEFSAFSQDFVLQPGESLYLSVPYTISGDAVTLNPGDQAWARVFLYFDVNRRDSTGLNMIPGPYAVMEWVSNDGLLGSGEDISGVLTMSLTGFTEQTTIELGLRGYVWLTAFTADVTPVPLPGAILLAGLGLSYSGIRLRRCA